MRFEDNAYEGLEEWVPPGRLKVPWPLMEAFRLEEERWAAVISDTPDRDQVEVSAATEVYELTVDVEIACLAPDGSYLTLIDIDTLAGLSGVPHVLVEDHPLTFRSKAGALVVCWSVALEVARELARHHSSTILAAVAFQEARQRFEAVHGRNDPGRGGAPDAVIDAATVRAVDVEMGRPRRDMLRAWCGAEAIDRWDELNDFREAADRAHTIAHEAIVALEKANLRTVAVRLRGKLAELRPESLPVTDEETGGLPH